MSKVKAYIKDCYSELVGKVSWPTFDELQGSVVIVMVACLIIAVIIFLMDVSFQTLMRVIY
jgi:preprotein translocase subunit SecE